MAARTTLDPCGEMGAAVVAAVGMAGERGQGPGAFTPPPLSRAAFRDDTVSGSQGTHPPGRVRHTTAQYRGEACVSGRGRRRAASGGDGDGDGDGDGGAAGVRPAGGIDPLPSASPQDIFGRSRVDERLGARS